jgi:oxygen-independent coproporphyrinogen III oxidase
VKGLYIHVPFCVRKCSYCDFYSLAGRDELQAAYIEALLKEAASYGEQSFQTLYLGGGTPSLLGSKLLERMVSGLYKRFDLSGLVEATIEVNPDSATPDLLECAKGLGIKRISMGVQSLDDRELRSVGRVHNTAQAIEAIKIARNRGFASISADLIAGLPGQSWQSLSRSLKTLVEMGIDHLSLYCLAVEEDTPLAANVPANLPTDDVQAELFDRACVFLADSGFTHYEISNFAKSGHECRHNLNYWRGGEYLGLGPAAASHLEGKRSRNKANLDNYLLDPTGQTEYVESLDIIDKAAEEAMLRLRLLEEGLDIYELQSKYGIENTAGLTARLDAMVNDGMLVRTGTSYRLDPSRVLTSNPIFAEVLTPR